MFVLNILKLNELVEANTKLLIMPLFCIPVTIAMLYFGSNVSLSSLAIKKPNGIKSMVIFILCAELALLIVAFITGLLFPDTQDPQITADTALYAVCSCIIGPIAEESLYRGALCCEADKFNTVLVSILFAVMHFSPANLFFYFILSIFCVRAMRKYDTIIAPIAMHSFSNLIMLIISHFS